MIADLAGVDANLQDYLQVRMVIRAQRQLTVSAANIAGLRNLRHILSQPAMLAKTVAEVEPGADVTNDEALLAHCRQSGALIYHPTCTARTGTDPKAVVDPSLRSITLMGCGWSMVRSCPRCSRVIPMTGS